MLLVSISDAEMDGDKDTSSLSMLNQKETDTKSCFLLTAYIYPGFNETERNTGFSLKLESKNIGYVLPCAYTFTICLYYVYHFIS